MENLHSHTEFCDGRASMAEMTEAACKAGFSTWGFSPHSPICCPSGANMKNQDVDVFLKEADRLRKKFIGKIRILTGMEIDYVSDKFGPHIEYFRSLPLDYRIGSVHFVRNQSAIPIDIDGPAERFLKYLYSEFEGDLRYVAETYFEEELEMLDRGGFDILGHLDKIGDNGSYAQSDLEDQDWYSELVEKVIAKAVAKDVVIEINTKKFATGHRFFPNVRWWPLLKKYGAKLILSTDAHYPEKVSAGYMAALERLRAECMEIQLIAIQ